MRSIPPLNGNDGDVFVDRNKATGEKGTVVPAEFFNAVRAELLEVIEGMGGLTPNADDLTQLRQAIEGAMDARLTSSIAILQQRALGGLPAAGGWRDVPLNTVAHPAPWLSLNANTGVVSVQPGEYEIGWSLGLEDHGGNISRCWSFTTATELGRALGVEGQSPTAVRTIGTGVAALSAPVPTDWHLQVYPQVTLNDPNYISSGYRGSGSLGHELDYDVYVIAWVRRLNR